MLPTSVSFQKNLIKEIHATKTNAACNISEGVVVESGLFARKLSIIMVMTHKHFIFMVSGGSIFNAERCII